MVANDLHNATGDSQSPPVLSAPKVSHATPPVVIAQVDRKREARHDG